MVSQHGQAGPQVVRNPAYDTNRLKGAKDPSQTTKQIWSPTGLKCFFSSRLSKPKNTHSRSKNMWSRRHAQTSKDKPITQHPSDVSSLNNSLEIRQKHEGFYSWVWKTSCQQTSKPNDQPDMLRSCWLLFFWGMWVHHWAEIIATWSTLHRLGLERIVKTCRVVEWPLNGKPKSVTHETEKFNLIRNTCD